jgi:hypothetical protein
MRRIPFLLAAGASAAACGTAGAFHQASLFKECRGGANDCRSLAPSAPLAVGARLRPAVEIDIAGTATPNVKVSSGAPDIIADDGDVLRGVAPGVAPVLVTADDGTVIDFLHVWVATPTRLAVDAAPTRADTLEEVTAPIQLVAGESRWLEPAVFGGAQRLAGAGDIAWHVECDAGANAACGEIALLTDGAPERRRLVARKPGSAHIALDGLGLHATVDVEVVP